MGVMQCGVDGCKNIMCDQYIEDVGYICDNCLNDLKYYLRDKALMSSAIFDFFAPRTCVKNDMKAIDIFINKNLKRILL